VSLFRVGNEVEVEFLLDSAGQVLGSLLGMKFEDFLFGDENFVILVLKVFRDSWRAGLSFVTGNKNIFGVEGNIVAFGLLIFLILSWTLTECGLFVEWTVFAEKDFFKFLSTGGLFGFDELNEAIEVHTLLFVL
jgi:hypothetical protein